MESAMARFGSISLGYPGMFAALLLASATVATGCSNGNVRMIRPTGDWSRVQSVQTLSFADDGGISGDAGCNRYSGTAQFQGTGSLTIGPVAATKRGCADPVIMRSETEFLRMFDQVRSYRLEAGDDRLSLLGEDGSLLAVFERSANAPIR
jgi:heat shock protein HslJ